MKNRSMSIGLAVGVLISLGLQLVDPALSASSPTESNQTLLPHNAQANLSNEPAAEPLPVAQAQVMGPEARNYIALIPLSIDEETEVDADEYDEEEDDDDEEEDDDYEEEDDYREHKPKKKKGKVGDHDCSSEKRTRNRRRRKRQRPRPDNDKPDKRPLILPLMMIPENQMNLKDKFSFVRNHQVHVVEDDVDDDTEDHGYVPYNGNKRPPRRLQTSHHDNKWRPHHHPQPPPAQRPKLYRKPGPPYPGPPPRAPNLPLDPTRIHPTNISPVYHHGPHDDDDSYDEDSSSSIVQVADPLENPGHKSATVIVIQQPQLPSWYSAPNPSIPQTSMATTTTESNRTADRRWDTRLPPNYDNLPANLLIDGILPSEPSDVADQVSLSKRTGFAAPSDKMTTRVKAPQSHHRPMSRRFASAPRQRPSYRRKYDQAEPERFSEYAHDQYSQRQPSRRYIHQSRVRDFKPLLDKPPALPSHAVFVNAPRTKPPVIRPPPRHPGVRIPGVRHPPNSASIQDIISQLSSHDGDNPRSSAASRPSSLDDDYPESYSRYELYNYRPPLTTKKGPDSRPLYYNQDQKFVPDPEAPTGEQKAQRPPAAAIYSRPTYVYHRHPAGQTAHSGHYSDSLTHLSQNVPTWKPPIKQDVHPPVANQQEATDMFDNQGLYSPSQDWFADRRIESNANDFLSAINRVQPILLQENVESNVEWSKPSALDLSDYKFYAIKESDHHQTAVNHKPSSLTSKVNLNAVNSYTSTWSDKQSPWLSSTAKPSSSNSLNRIHSGSLGSPTGLFDASRPDGPDYSSATSLVNSDQDIVNIGIDLYPMKDKKHGNRRSDNGQKVLLHLNLMSQRPEEETKSLSFGPFTYHGRQHVASKTEPDERTDPIFGAIDPAGLIHSLLQSQASTGGISSSSSQPDAHRPDASRANHQSSHDVISTQESRHKLQQEPPLKSGAGHGLNASSAGTSHIPEEKPKLDGKDQDEEQEYQYLYYYYYDYVDPDGEQDVGSKKNQDLPEHLPEPAFQRVGQSDQQYNEDRATTSRPDPQPLGLPPNPM